MADDDLHCAPAPTPASPSPSGPTAPADRGAMTRAKRYALLAILAFAAIAGVVFTLAVNGYVPGAASASEAAGTPDADEAPAPAGETEAAAPADCLGENPDDNRRWYCEEFLPFAMKAAADHGRIDAQEKRLKELEARQGGSLSSTHPAIWILFLALGGWVVVLTIRLHRLRRA